LQVRVKLTLTGLTMSALVMKHKLGLVQGDQKIGKKFPIFIM
jgi:hypothetical protein